jgi:hypothetical protein
MEIPFIGGAYQGRSIQMDPQECVNWYVELDKEGGAPMALIGCPGTTQFGGGGATVPVRQMIVVGGYLYVVAGDTLYKIDSDGTTVSVISGTLTTLTGYLYMEHDGTHLMVVDPGIAGYYYDTAGAGSLTQITAPGFPIPSSLTWQDGYFIVSQYNSGNFFISAPYDPTSWDALDYGTAEASPDNLLRVFSDHLNLWLIGEKTTEIWYNSGSALFPFERIPGAYILQGIKAPGSMAAGAESIFWLTDKLQVIQVTGTSPKFVSTRQIEYQIASCVFPQTDAIGFCYSDEGHEFYVLTFPSGAATWVYDATTGFWHKRASWPVIGNGQYGRHRANCYAYFASNHLVGDYANGKIYRWCLNVYDDNGQTLAAIRTAQTMRSDQKTMFFHNLELNFEKGVGTVVGQGLTPQAILTWSDDGGETYSNELWSGIGAPMGDIGEYKMRTRWSRLGKSRNRVWRVAVTDPVKRTLISAHAEVTVGNF